MRVTLLNGAPAPDDAADEIANLLERRFRTGGNHVRAFHLRSFNIGHCLGDLDCWVRTPGRCRIPDEGQQIEKAVHDADLLIFVTPVVFGGYGADLKRAVDRLIPLILPFFVKRADLTHHEARYQRLPHLLGIGHDPAPTPERATLFSAFIESNALNLGTPGWNAAVLDDDRSGWSARLEAVLAADRVPGNASGSAEGATAHLHAMMQAELTELPFQDRPKVAILQGSARPAHESTSESLARYLAAKIEAAGGTVQIVPATSFARGTEPAAAAARVLADADILVVASPLYVDALPSLVVLALQQVHELRRSGFGQSPARLMGMVNCGFPEPEQVRFALGALRQFARDAGYTYAGSLGVGGGEAIHGRPLEATGGMTRHLRAALDEAAVALVAGGTVPFEPAVAAAHAFLPPPLYRMAGWFGWWRQARQHGIALKELRGRPFDALSAEDWAKAAGGTMRARPLRVIDKRAEAEDAITISFEDPAHDPLAYEAGQHLTLEATIGGETVRRAYSLSSVPYEAALSITVKRVPGGLMSNHLHETLKVGDLIRSHGPSGSFVAGPAPAQRKRRLLLIAGGAGIAPLFAIARQVLATEPAAEVTLIYGAHSLQRAIFAGQLGDLARAYSGRLTLAMVLEQPPDAWSGSVGRLADAVLDGLLPPDPAGIEQAFICGPDAMQTAVRSSLLRHGLAAERIRSESFVSPRRAAHPGTAQTATLVAESGDERVIAVAAGQTLLDALLDAGESLSFSCLSGGCGACRVRITGQFANIVLDVPNPVGAADLAAGIVPACIARLAGPVRFARV